jgi:agmatinase
MEAFVTRLFFLESEGGKTTEDSLFHIIPVPYEKTVSYGKGTASGPEAIIKASQQLEAFDGKSLPLEKGIYTHPQIDCSGEELTVLHDIEKVIMDVLQKNKIPIVLGGEHSISYGPVLAHKKYFKKIGILHFDAHADLRDEMEGNKFAHGCVMRRIHEQGIPLIQIGTRAYSIEEKTYRKENPDIKFYDASDIYLNNNFSLKFPHDFPDDIYISIDIDGFDISIFPHTGTPVPGGLLWYDFFKFIESIPPEKKIRGFDVVELAPTKNSRSSDFAAAQLVYNMMGIISRRI